MSTTIQTNVTTDQEETTENKDEIGLKRDSREGYGTWP